MSNRYKAQGCAFITACVLAGWGLAVATINRQDDTAASNIVQPAADNATTAETEAPAKAASSPAKVRADWLVGTWAAAGDCTSQGTYFFRFKDDGQFEAPDMSGTYTVGDDLISLDLRNATDDVVKELGGTSAEIAYSRDAATGQVIFKDKPMERCESG